MIQNAAGSLPPLQTLVFLISGVVGVVAVIVSLASHFSNSRRGDSPSAATVAGLVFGSLLLSLTQVMAVWSTSLFGAAADPQIVEAYNPTTPDNVRRTLQAITLYINLIGWIAGARALWIWRSGPVYKEQGWVFKGFVFLTAGAFATNFALFVDMLANTVGAEPLGTLYFTF